MHDLWRVATYCWFPCSSLPVALGESSCVVLRDRFPRSLSSLDPCLDTEPFPSSGYWHWSLAESDGATSTDRPLLVAFDSPCSTTETPRPGPRVLLTTLDTRATRLGRRRRTRPTSAGTSRTQGRLRPVPGDGRVAGCGIPAGRTRVGVVRVVRMRMGQTMCMGLSCRQA